MRENKSLLHSPLIYSGDSIENFVHLQHFPASIKDAKTGRYQACNAALSTRDGIPMPEYIGLTSYSIGEMMHHKEAMIKNAVEMDKRIFNGIVPYTQYKQILPIYEGFISIEEVIKKPIINKQEGIIVGLFAYARDITPYVDPLYLFSVYQQYYPIKKAIQYFLRSIQLEHVFYSLPTKRELMTLLAMRKTSNAKYMARELNLSPRTVDENKSRLRDKLKVIPLDELLIKLRIRNELYSINDS
jgi:hypothetical protein